MEISSKKSKEEAYLRDNKQNYTSPQTFRNFAGMETLVSTFTYDITPSLNYSD